MNDMLNFSMFTEPLLYRSACHILLEVSQDIHLDISSHKPHTHQYPLDIHLKILISETVISIKTDVKNTF